MRSGVRDRSLPGDGVKEQGERIKRPDGGRIGDSGRRDSVESGERGIERIGNDDLTEGIERSGLRKRVVRPRQHSRGKKSR